MLEKTLLTLGRFTVTSNYLSAAEPVDLTSHDDLPNLVVPVMHAHTLKIRDLYLRVTVDPEFGRVHREVDVNQVVAKFHQALDEALREHDYHTVIGQQRPGIAAVDHYNHELEGLLIASCVEHGDREDLKSRLGGELALTFSTVSSDMAFNFNVPYRRLMLNSLRTTAPANPNLYAMPMSVAVEIKPNVEITLRVADEVGQDLKTIPARLSCREAEYLHACVGDERLTVLQAKQLLEAFIEAQLPNVQVGRANISAKILVLDLEACIDRPFGMQMVGQTRHW